MIGNVTPMELLIKTASLLQEEKLVDKTGIISLRDGDTIYFSFGEDNYNSTKRTELDIINQTDLSDGSPLPDGAALHREVYRNRPDINALIQSTGPSVLCCSKTGETVKPLLDDMAQLVGTSIRTAPGDISPESMKKLLKAMKKRNAVFTAGRGALCGAGTMDDAHAVCQVAEKACQAWIESCILGGGHIINPLEALLMRMVYLKKYSNQAAKNI